MMGKTKRPRENWGLPSMCKSQLNGKRFYYKSDSVVHFLDFTGSVGKSADSAFLSASVDDPDDAFVGFTYVPPTDLTE